MHCSANVGEEATRPSSSASPAPARRRSAPIPRATSSATTSTAGAPNGVFNFEDGCYAKVIRLSPDAEPQIYASTRRFGTILENVVYDPVSRLLDLNDEKLTENTRGAYPLDFIANAVPDKRAGHPKNVVFLTCDACGRHAAHLAPRRPDQAIYHFISGYTSKIAGTEIGLGIEPEITFSACFGGPFMVHHPYVYADLLKKKMLQHGATCWLVNTGWTGGPFGVGKRISIGHTRKLLNAALSGRARPASSYRKDPVFGFDVPESCEGVPGEILEPANTWGSREEYFKKYDALAARFIENFKLMADGLPARRGRARPEAAHGDADQGRRLGQRLERAAAPSGRAQSGRRQRRPGKRA